MALSSDQTTDMLADLASGALNDVFTQIELDRLYARAGEDYNLAVYYGWRQIAGDAARWVDYQVAQTKVSRSQAFAQITTMLELWASDSRTTANQVAILGMRPVPTIWKDEPADESTLQSGTTNRSHTNWRDW